MRLCGDHNSFLRAIHGDSSIFPFFKSHCSHFSVCTLIDFRVATCRKSRFRLLVAVFSPMKIAHRGINDNPDDEVLMVIISTITVSVEIIPRRGTLVFIAQNYAFTSLFTLIAFTYSRLT